MSRCAIKLRMLRWMANISLHFHFVLGITIAIEPAMLAYWAEQMGHSKHKLAD